MASRMSSKNKQAKLRKLRRRRGNRCAHCGGGGPLTLDHIVPRSKDGGNELENLQLLCKPCNQKKGSHDERYLPPPERAQKVKRYVS